MSEKNKTNHIQSPTAKDLELYKKNACNDVKAVIPKKNQLKQI